MGLANKITLIVAAIVGVICTLAAIIGLRGAFNLSSRPAFLEAGIALLFIALFIFAGLLIFLLVTLCCSCSDFVIGILGIVTGVAALIFGIASYSSLMKPVIEAKTEIPTPPEWIIGGVTTAVGVILIGITIMVDN
ncbi:hypothetical protein EG68_06426 [Paragonimus skrjabini miyazakii]|uniref:Uncharacterized protein n=1 Tax=Paragonimus skrjabini miyazakii TaxID=59628 RepID=A0A8S9YSM9_9TREM|nr:hypothetical protein EG68_06426 [Paragonimus skrjabini miyazakii]